MCIMYIHNVHVQCMCKCGWMVFILGQSLWQLERNENSLTAGNLATITSFGEPLMEAVCRDAKSGHDVTRVSRREVFCVF